MRKTEPKVLFCFWALFMRLAHKQSRRPKNPRIEDSRVSTRNRKMVVYQYQPLAETDFRPFSRNDRPTGRSFRICPKSTLKCWFCVNPMFRPFSSSDVIILESILSHYPIFWLISAKIWCFSDFEQKCSKSSILSFSGNPKDFPKMLVNH